MSGVPCQEDAALAVALRNLSRKRKGLRSQQFYVEVSYPDSCAYQSNPPLSVVVLDPLAVLRVPLHAKDPAVSGTGTHKDARGLWMLDDVQPMKLACDEPLQVST